MLLRSKFYLRVSGRMLGRRRNLSDHKLNPGPIIELEKRPGATQRLLEGRKQVYAIGIPLRFLSMKVDNDQRAAARTATLCKGNQIHGA